MNCESPEKKEGSFLLEVLEELGSRRSPAYSEIDVAVPIVECQIQKYWVHGVEVSEDARRDKPCCPQPDFWRNSLNHGRNPEPNLSKSRSRKLLCKDTPIYDDVQGGGCPTVHVILEGLESVRPSPHKKN